MKRWAMMAAVLKSFRDVRIVERSKRKRLGRLYTAEAMNYEGPSVSKKDL